jgi:hypothetical protein
MNVDVEASDGIIPRKRGRDAVVMIHTDGVSSFEARRINVGFPFKFKVFLFFYFSDHALCNLTSIIRHAGSLSIQACK